MRVIHLTYAVRCLTVTRNMFFSLWQCLLCSFPSAASLLLKKYHGGYVVLRLALAGHKQANRPFYRIVAAYNKKARDGKYIEQLGSYDPLPNIYNEKLISFNFDRIKYWIGCGAHPSKPVAKLLGVYSLHEQVSLKVDQHCSISLSACPDNCACHIDLFNQGGSSVALWALTSFRQYSSRDIPLSVDCSLKCLIWFIYYMLP